MKCMSCKMEEMQETTHVYFANLEHCYVIIENVPCFRCPQCNEIYYKTSTLEKIDDMLGSIEKIASKIFIIDYQQAA